MGICTPYYHVAVVVDDLEADLDRIGTALGLTWTTIHRASSWVEMPAGRIETVVEFAYSIEGPPYLEVLQRTPRTPWSRSGLHHVGWWSSDQPTISSRLDDLGCVRTAVQVAEDGQWAGGLFHEITDGFVVEMVNEATVAPRLARWLGGGSFAAGAIDVPGRGGES